MAESYIVGSETLPTKVVGSNAQEPFKGTSDYTHTFTKPMTGFSIKNSGSQELEFVINNYKFSVDAGESFEAQFHPFTIVKITGQTSFKAFGMGTGGVAAFVVVDESYISTLDRVNIVYGTTASMRYRGSQFKVKKNKKLRQVKSHSNAIGWEVWESDNVGQFLTKLQAGVFAGADTNGFLVADLATPISLSKDKYYTIVAVFNDTPQYYFVWTASSGAGSGKVTYPIETDSLTITGVSAQRTTAFSETSSIATNGVTNTFVYDFKVGLSDT